MIARGPGGADSKDWAASMVAAMLAGEPPTRSALIALSASARCSLRGATTSGWPAAATTMVCAPSGSRNRNSAAPLCTAASSCDVRPDAVSITRATERSPDAMGLTVVATGFPSIVTEQDSAADPFSGGVTGVSTTIEMRCAEAEWTAITRNSSAAAAAGCEANRRNKTKPTALDAISEGPPPRSRRLSSEDNQVFSVGSSSPIIGSPASNQSQLRVKRGVVDEVARERHLSVPTLPGHHEPCSGAVCSIDENLVATLQLVEPEEDGRSGLRVHMPQDYSRSNLPWPGAAFPPAGDAGLARHLDAL